ncbi:hypothetical protein NBZ79_12395 [Sneathiella marina]|uniref:Secreted protein n=1 Tax=Sneathiella marina TaxID=2950108 RepID=A0ABY4VZ69_9PROT|nr:hypothetical protein [Sneathiella marina]USG59977.1 hypothetical protein NBZ79_12395 [Sneathiella marina]
MTYKLNLLTLVFFVFSVTLVTPAIYGTASAEEKFSFGRSIEGTYILDQHSETDRSSYTFTEFGSVIWSAADQKKYSYFPGAGVWKQTGDHQISVRIISFDYDNKGIGIVDMKFNFDDKFQTVTGKFKGGIYPLDVDVNVIDKKPMQEFESDFTGVRLSNAGG